MDVLSAFLNVPSGETRYAAGGNGGGLSAIPATDGQNYGDGGSGPTTNTETVAPSRGNAGHWGVLYVQIPYTPPAAAPVEEEIL